jgi:hypothetical protein
MNIDKFKNALAKGGVRPFLFRVQGAIGNTSLPTKVGYLCKAASLPSSTIGTIEVPFRGRKIKLPGEREYGEWSLTFLCDGDFDLRNAFEQWMDDINQTVSNLSTTEHNLSGPLFPDWRIDHLDRTGEPIKSYQFFHCWPSEVGSIDVSTDGTDLAEFTVNLQYTYFVTQNTDVSVQPGIAAVPGSDI